MRELKFRAWNKNLKLMITETPFDITEFGVNAPTFQLKDVTKRGDEYEVMQFTGLLDKKGKEIYEGDIVKKQNYSYDWYRGGRNKRPSGVTLKTIVFRNLPGVAGWNIGTNAKVDYEVIGNRYENPALMDMTSDMINKRPDLERSHEN